MAFWGVEITTEKPATHSSENGRRLRVSHATLGLKGYPTRTTVQCRVGNRCPFPMCVLLPNVTESCFLDLEFEEADDVVFSVVGGSTVYLTGYYKPALDGEPCGEDIQQTDDSSSDWDDAYDDSFINDDDVVQDSLQSSDHGTLRNDKRKLRKKTQIVESSDTDCTLSQLTMKKKTLSKMDDSQNVDLSVELERVEKKNVDPMSLHMEAGKEEKSESMIQGNNLEYAIVVWSSLVGNGKDQNQEQSPDLEPQDGQKSEANNEKRVEDGEKNEYSSEKINVCGQEMLLLKDHLQSTETKHEFDEEKRYDNQNLSLANGNGLMQPSYLVKPKRKRTARSTKKGKTEQIPTEEQEIEAYCGVACDLLADADEKTTGKKKKKKKTRSKKELIDCVNNEESGVIIEELEIGARDGEVATLDKEVSIYYTAMLKKGGEVIDTNVGKPPIKFVLGDQRVVDGLKVGICGMHVGDKRRIIVPPAMGLGEHNNIPPNSWLVYDVELVDA